MLSNFKYIKLFKKEELPEITTPLKLVFMSRVTELKGIKEAVEIIKKIKPVYQDENYVILPIENDAENQVELYDDIIVKGVNLYDGKYL